MNHKLKKKIESFFSDFPLGFRKKGEMLIGIDDEPDSVFYLSKGYVREYAFSDQGVELTLHIFVPGSFFPMTLVLTNIKNRYYYEALTPIEVYAVPKDAMLKFLKKEPAVVLDLTRRVFLGMDKLLMRIEYLILGSAKKRVISTLLFLARHFGVGKNKDIRLRYLFTHRDIASFAGISRETASRELKKLLKKNLIAYEKRLITIKNADLLKKQGIV